MRWVKKAPEKMSGTFALLSHLIVRFALRWRTAMKEERIMSHARAMLLAVTLSFAGFAAVAQSPAPPTDPQIAHIAYTAGQIDISAAELALKNSKNKAVRDFAEEMVRDHTAVNKQALALLDKLKVKPEDNGTSKSLSDGAAKKRDELSKLSGSDFDKAYAQNEVAYHKTVNGALATALIPNSNNGELKSLLETGLKLFTEHQKHAEHLADQLR
jgi:putative membrane protein